MKTPSRIFPLFRTHISTIDLLVKVIGRTDVTVVTIVQVMTNELVKLEIGIRTNTANHLTMIAGPRSVLACLLALSMKNDVKDRGAATAGPTIGLPQMRSIKDIARMATDTDLSPYISNTPKRAVRTLLHIKTNILPLGREERETARHRQGQGQIHPMRIATDDTVSIAATASQDHSHVREKVKTTIENHRKRPRKQLRKLKPALQASLKSK